MRILPVLYVQSGPFCSLHQVVLCAQYPELAVQQPLTHLSFMMKPAANPECESANPTCGVRVSVAASRWVKKVFELKIEGLGFGVWGLVFP